VDTALVKLALIVSEVGEAIESVRANDTHFAEELADICIRVFDLAAARGHDLEDAIITKMQRNASRPHMHGKLA
jgi:NTP pyrophosphatase (non-canonical NTP hydrolase)